MMKDSFTQTENTRKHLTLEQLMDVVADVSKHITAEEMVQLLDTITHYVKAQDAADKATAQAEGIYNEILKICKTEPAVTAAPKESVFKTTHTLPAQVFPSPSHSQLTVLKELAKNPREWRSILSQPVHYKEVDTTVLHVMFATDLVNEVMAEILDEVTASDLLNMGTRYTDKNGVRPIDLLPNHKPNIYTPITEETYRSIFETDVTSPVTYRCRPLTELFYKANLGEQLRFMKRVMRTRANDIKASKQVGESSVAKATRTSLADAPNATGATDDATPAVQFGAGLSRDNLS